MTSKENMRPAILGKAKNGILAALAAFTLPYIVPMSNKLDYTNSIWPLFVFAGAWWFFAIFLKKDFSLQRRYSLPPAVILSFFLVAGRQISENDLIAKEAVFLVIPIALLGLVLYLLISQLMKSMEKCGKVLAERRPSALERFFSLPYWPIISATLLILAWLPMWLSSWPGTFYGDSIIQIEQFANDSLGGNYPLMHTLVMGSIICGIQRLTGSLAAGVAVFVGLQMLYIAGVFTYSLVFLKRRNASTVVLLIAWLMFAFSPVILLFCKDTVRDVLFSTTTLLFGIILSEFLAEPEGFFQSRLRVAALVVAGFMAMTLRNAAPILIICLALFLCVRAIALRKSYRWEVISVFAVIIGFFSLWSIVSQSILVTEEDRPESREMLSVPIQQIVCVKYYGQDELTPEDRQMISELFPYTLSTWYDNDNVDQWKANFADSVFTADVAKYAAWWAGLCVRFPARTFGSFLRLNVESWYPDTVFDSYTTPPWVCFDHETTYYLPDYSVIEMEMSKLPGLFKLQEMVSFDISFSRIPMISMAFSPAFAMYVLLLCAFYLAYQKRMTEGVTVIIALLVQFATFFGSTVVLRYYLLTFFTLPIAVALMLSPSVGASGMQEDMTGMRK